jgi:hypothetical protein
MRARTITIISLLVCALAIPAPASAELVPSGYSAPISGTGSSGGEPAVGTAAGATDTINRPTPTDHRGAFGSTIPAPPAAAEHGLDLESAAVGAGAAMALVALGGAGFLTVRRRTAVSSSAPSIS